MGFLFVAVMPANTTCLHANRRMRVSMHWRSTAETRRASNALRLLGLRGAFCAARNLKSLIVVAATWTKDGQAYVQLTTGQVEES